MVLIMVWEGRVMWSCLFSLAMVISDCNVAWKDKIRKTTFQEERDTKKVICYTYKVSVVGD